MSECIDLRKLIGFAYLSHVKTHIGCELVAKPTAGAACVPV